MCGNSGGFCGNIGGCGSFDSSRFDSGPGFADSINDPDNGCAVDLIALHWVVLMADLTGVVIHSVDRGSCDIRFGGFGCYTLLIFCTI